MAKRNEKIVIPEGTLTEENAKEFQEAPAKIEVFPAGLLGEVTGFNAKAGGKVELFVLVDGVYDDFKIGDKYTLTK
jgi:hypothetical protein